MSTKKETTEATTASKTVNPTAAVSDVRGALEKMVALGLMTEEQLDKQLAQVEAGMKAPARSTVSETIEKAVKDALNTKEIEQAFKILGKGAFGVNFTIKEGKLAVIKVTAKNTKSGSGIAGKKAKLMVNGKQYNSYAQLCSDHSLRVAGDSAVRVWERWHLKDPEAYPAVDEIPA